MWPSYINPLLENLGKCLGNAVAILIKSSKSNLTILSYKLKLKKCTCIAQKSKNYKCMKGYEGPNFFWSVWGKNGKVKALFYLYNIHHWHTWIDNRSQKIAPNPVIVIRKWGLITVWEVSKPLTITKKNKKNIEN